MSKSRVARRYAQALLNASSEGKLDERVAEDLESLGKTLRQSKDLSALLKSPVVKRELKQNALKSIFESHLHPLTMEFLDFLTEKGREDVLPEVIVWFKRLRDERLGVMTVDVDTAAELTQDQQTALRQRFEKLSQKSIRFAFRLDPTLKGGFRARVGDTVYDGTLRRQLEILRRRLEEGEFNN